MLLDGNLRKNLVLNLFLDNAIMDLKLTENELKDILKCLESKKETKHLYNKIWSWNINYRRKKTWILLKIL